MADIKRCDRCKEIYERDETKENIKLCAPYDLCEECSFEFNKFMENKKGVVLLDPENTFCRDCGRCTANPLDENKVNYCTVFHCVKLGHEKMCAFFREKKMKKNEQ